MMLTRSLAGETYLQWYVAYTFPKSEKKVQNKLEKLGIQSFLPLHPVIREWSDRRKKLIVPLFPNYIFVHTTVDKRHETFEIKEIVKYVSFNGKAATVEDSVVDSLKMILERNVDVHVEDNVSMGSVVRIMQGPLMGTEGIVVRRNGNSRLIVRIEALQRAISVNISLNDILLSHLPEEWPVHP